jgi:hypothetical protein
MVACAPRVDLGPGRPAIEPPEMPDCDQPRRADAHTENRPAQLWLSVNGESFVVEYRDNAPETKQCRGSTQQGTCGEPERVFAVAFRKILRIARTTCGSPAKALLKGCESLSKKSSACTMSGAALLHFRAGAPSCTCAEQFFALRRWSGSSQSQAPRPVARRRVCAAMRQCPAETAAARSPPRGTVAHASQRSPCTANTRVRQPRQSGHGTSVRTRYHQVIRTGARRRAFRHCWE